MTQIKKAVFPVAGFGTRFLPATKAMPKELLPIVDKPLIQYAAEEAVKAGIDTLIFVTGRNKRAIEDHFDNNKELEDSLRLKGKHDQANLIKNILPKGVECIFVRQSEQLGLGHAVMCAERVIGGEPFAVLLADDFIIPHGKGPTNDLVNNFYKSGKLQLSVMKVEDSEISKYGVLKLSKNGKSMVGLVEKPKLSDAPSNLASIGRYVLTYEIFDVLRNLELGQNGEIQLADAIDILARKGKAEAVKLNGKRFDCGFRKGFIEANVEVFKQIQINSENSK